MGSDLNGYSSDSVRISNGSKRILGLTPRRYRPAPFHKQSKLHTVWVDCIHHTIKPNIHILTTWRAEPFVLTCPLLYFFWPATHMVVYGFLRLLGLNTRSLRAGMTDVERWDSIARFNDPNSDIQVMVSSYPAGGTSINLQRGCSWLLIMKVCLSIPINKLVPDCLFPPPLTALRDCRRWSL